MEYYSVLPNEIKGNINSFLLKDITSELKYSNRDTFNSMRYVNTLHDNIVYLRRLFIKNNLNKTYTPFYYNLTSIKGKLIVSSNTDELLLAHRIIKKLTSSVEIIYTGNSIVTLFPLIQTFIESKCHKMEVYLKKDMLYFFTVERRNHLIVANILKVMRQKEISLYLKGVDSLLLNESYNTTNSYCSKNRNILKEIKLDGEYASDILVEDSKEILYHNKLVEFIIQHNIHTLHLSGYGGYPEFSEVLQLVNTLYIVSFDNNGYKYDYFGFIEEMEENDGNTIIFPGITKVVMEHILISNQIEERHTPYYKIHSRLLPNAIIEVFKMNESDVIEGDNINIVEDNARVKSLERQRLSNLLLADRNIRFPNLNNISEIIVGIDEYEDSVDYIRKLIKVVDSLHIIIEAGEQRILPDMLKYSVFIGNVVKKKLIIATYAAYDKRITFSFTMTTIGVQFEVNTRNLTKDDYYDISYLFLHDTIIKVYQQQPDLAFDLVNKLGQTKIILSGSACNTKHYIMCLPDNIDTLYIYDRHIPTSVKEIAGMKPNTNIKNIFYDCEENIKLLDYTNSSLKTIFPNCIFHIIDNIYSTQLYLNY